MSRTGFLLLFLALAACAAPGSLPPTLSNQPSAAPSAAPLFEFRTGFWVSLHHHLRGEARRLPAAREGKFDRDPDPAKLPTDERDAWEEALAVYERKMAPRDLLFDVGMIEIKDALADIGDSPDLSALRGRFDDEALDALERAAFVYRKRLWPKHERLSKAWIASIQPLVERYGPAIAPRLAALYGATWPAPVQVEVLPEAGQFGAYTSLNPTRVSISDQDPRDAVPAGLEVLFHESSHGWGDRLMKPLEDEADRRKVILPDTLWHAVLFYLAGEVVRTELERAGTPGYVAYADTNGLWDRSWKGLREPIATACAPWLRGERSRDEALVTLVAAVGKPRT